MTPQTDKPEEPDDVNLWRPNGKAYRGQQPGDPFLCKPRAPRNAIAGDGVFFISRQLPVLQAWIAIERRNSRRHFDELRTRTHQNNRAPRRTAPSDALVGAVPRIQPFFFADDELVPLPATPSADSGTYTRARAAFTTSSRAPVGASRASLAANL